MYRAFGSWPAALRAAGFDVPDPPPARPGGWDQAAVLDAVDEWTRRFGEPPTVMDWAPALARRHGRDEVADLWERERPRWPHASLAARRFGGWNRMLQAAGQRHTQQGLQRAAPRPMNAPDGELVRAWTREEVVAAIRQWRSEHGRLPTAYDWQAGDPGGTRPSSRTVARLFGSWPRAMMAVLTE